MIHFADRLVGSVNPSLFLFGAIHKHAVPQCVTADLVTRLVFRAQFSSDRVVA